MGKISQELLGHSSLKTTMDRYVHVTDDSKEKAVQQFEKAENDLIGVKPTQKVLKPLK